MDPEANQQAPESRSSAAEIAEAAVRRIVTAIVIGAGVIALAIYARPGPPRFQVQATPGGIVRIDTRSGTVIGCEGGRCTHLLKRGQKLGANPNLNIKASAELPAPAAPSAPSAPAR